MGDYASTRVQKELLLALESARMRFAVAVAAETKSTPLKQWQNYMETADRIRRLIRNLRNEGCTWVSAHNGWIPALNLLRHLPVHDDAQGLCKILGDIMEELE